MHSQPVFEQGGGNHRSLLSGTPFGLAPALLFRINGLAGFWLKRDFRFGELDIMSCEWPHGRWMSQHEVMHDSW